MREAHIRSIVNRLGALALTLSDGIPEATKTATGMAGGIPAAPVSLREWADGTSVDVLAEALRVSHSRAGPSISETVGRPWRPMRRGAAVSESSRLGVAP